MDFLLQEFFPLPLLPMFHDILLGQLKISIPQHYHRQSIIYLFVVFDPPLFTTHRASQSGSYTNKYVMQYIIKQLNDLYLKSPNQNLKTKP